MHVTYDPAVDAAYISFTDAALEPGRDSMPLIEVLEREGVMAVLDWKDGQIVGLEVQGASAHLPADLIQCAAPVPGHAD